MNDEVKIPFYHKIIGSFHSIIKVDYVHRVSHVGVDAVHAVVCTRQKVWSM